VQVRNVTLKWLEKGRDVARVARTVDIAKMMKTCGFD
jgi:hypothetical protein